MISHGPRDSAAILAARLDTARHGGTGRRPAHWHGAGHPGPGRPGRRGHRLAEQPAGRLGPGRAGLTPAVLASGTFGQLFSTKVNGQVFAAADGGGARRSSWPPMNDWVYGLNAATGAIKWKTSARRPCSRVRRMSALTLTPNTGVTGHAGLRPLHRHRLPGARWSRPGARSSTPSSPARDQRRRPGPNGPAGRCRSTARPVNDPDQAVQPVHRAGSGPGCCCSTARSTRRSARTATSRRTPGTWPASTPARRALTLWSDEAGLTDNQGGIWQSGGGLMSDGPGRIFLATGNGVSPAPGPGTNPPGSSATRWSGSACRAWRHAASRGLLQPGERAERWTRPTPTSARAARSGCRSAPAPTRTCWSRRARTAGSSC